MEVNTFELFSNYEREALKTAIYPRQGHNIEYATLGLCGEAGELANKVKKVLRDDGGVLTDDAKDKIEDEGGDILWYLSAVAREAGTTLDKMAQRNLAKLKSRAQRGRLSGSGDER